MPDKAYQTFSYRMASSGLVARDVYDKMRPGSWRNLQNVESRQENSLSTRYGHSLLTTDGVNNFPLTGTVPGIPIVHSISRMQGLSQPFNYAGATSFLFRRTGDAAGQYTQLSNALSGNRLSMYPYRPDANSNPYMFIADNGVLLKDNGSLAAAQKWGVAPPTQPALSAPLPASLLNIELFNEANTASFTVANLGSGTMKSRVSCVLNSSVTSLGLTFVAVSVPRPTSNLVRSGGVVTVSVSPFTHGYATGMRVALGGANDPSFNAASAVITVTGASTFTYANTGPDAVSGASSCTTTPMPSLDVGMLVTTTDANAETVYITQVTGSSTIGGIPSQSGFVANFKKTHTAPFGITSNYLSGTVAANTVATVSKPGALNLSFANTTVQPQNDLIQLWVLTSNPLAIQEIKVLFDVGDGSFTQDYFSKSVVMSAAQPAASGTIPSDAVQSSAVFRRAGGILDQRSLGGGQGSLLPTDLPLLQQLQPVALNPGGAVWTLFQARLSEFVENGAAGAFGNSWQNIVSWRVQIQTSATLTTTIGLDDLALVGGSDLDSFAGQAYDYRSTFYNINTGCESTPSVIQIASDPTTFNLFKGAPLPIPVTVQRTAIQVTPQQPTDTQVTHMRIYRRGGTLTTAWYFVAQIPVGTLTFTDTLADSLILVNNQLNINADPPITSVLQSPLNTTVYIQAPRLGFASLGPGLTTVTLTSGTVYTGQFVTIDQGQLQEQCYVQSASTTGGVTTLTLYLQLFHGTAVNNGRRSAAIAANTQPQVPMNLMAIAFDKAWLAGDPNNPHVLYYSTTYKPETFPQANFIEVGTPDAPIMALVELRGMLYAFTTKRVYQILGAGSSVPICIPTGVSHGLAAQFAWAKSENAVFYLSYDGVYVFQGSSSPYLTEPVEWIFTGKNLGPVPAIDTTQKSQIVMAYANHEVFVRYVDQAGKSHRLIFSDTYNRWRNDDTAVNNTTSMYFAEDIGALYFGQDDGNVYQDRVGDTDSRGFVAGVAVVDPINFTLQTAQMDHSEVDPTYAKRSKVYNELTIEADLNGQTVNVSAVFDSGNTIMPLGTLTGTGRKQFQLNINQGNGYSSLNVGLLLTGSTTAVMHYFECHIRAVPQAEYRKSFDTYWCGFGVDEWHVYKQVFAEYAAPDPGGVTVNAFMDGNMSAPVFTFTLPSTGTLARASKKVRFPAMKCRLVRFVGTSASDFQVYDDTEWEHKLLGSNKGYERGKLSP